MAGIPYRSKMQPHWAAIKSMRESGSTWKEIVEHLEGSGVSTEPSGVHRYYKRMTRPQKKGLGLPGWGNSAPVYSDPATAKAQAPDAAGEGSAVPKPVKKPNLPPEAEDFDFTPSPEKDPFAALEKALRGKPDSTATNTETSKKQ